MITHFWWLSLIRMLPPLQPITWILICPPWVILVILGIFYLLLKKTFSLFLFLVIHPCFWIISVFQKSPQLKFLGLCLILYLPGRSILIVFWVAVNNVWATTADPSLIVMMSSSTGFILCWSTAPFLTYSGAAFSHLNRLSSLQTRVENTCGFSIPTLASHRNASTLDFTCYLLNGKVRDNLQSFCPSFQTEILRQDYMALTLLAISVFITL